MLITMMLQVRKKEQRAYLCFDNNIVGSSTFTWGLENDTVIVLKDKPIRKQDGRARGYNDVVGNV